MPLNAAIPMSYQAPDLPDVNAMMQTRAAGLENIYKIEQQRQASAAEAAQAEADAAFEAIAPAIATAFSDPSDAGLDAALTIVPPQYQEMARAQIDQLRAIPDLNLRKNVMRGALAQDDYGRAILAQVEPTANMRLQAETAAQRAALDARRLALEEQQLVTGERMTPYQEAQIALEREKFAAEQEAAARQAEAGGVDPKVKLKLDQAYPQASRALQSATTKIDQDIEDVENLLKDTEGLTAITGGVYGAYAPNISAAANRAQALLDKIKAGAGFTALQEMRDASPTGGALGNVSNTEGQKLEDSVATFSQRQSLRDFQNGLKQYLIDLKTAKENVQSTFDETYSYRGEAPSVDIIESASERRKRIREETMPQTSPALPPGVTVKKKTPTQED